MSVMRSRVEMLAACYKGGGGGGSSGTTDYPAYMKDIHGLWLNDNGVASMTAGNDITSLIDDAIGASPYNGVSAFDPSSTITNMFSALADFETDLSGAATWADFVDLANTTVNSVILTDVEIEAATNVHAALIADRLTTEVLPRFQTGMRDINAVISSSFVIGQAILEAFNTREVSDYAQKLRLQRTQWMIDGVKDQISMLNTQLQFRDSYAKMYIEASRISAVMSKEQIDEQLDIDAKDVTWGIDLYANAGNLLASISGAAVSNTKSPSKFNSALGGALSGASAGAMVGGPVGAGIGAVVGLAGGLLG